jgi:hypothetical protein
MPLLDLSQEMQGALSILTLIGVLVLIAKVFDLKLGSEGFYADNSGSSMRHTGERSDGYAAAGHVVANQRHNTVEGLGASEPPVFWNSGSYNDVSQYMQNSNNQVVDVDYRLTSGEVASNNTNTEGMMYGRKTPAYEGMANKYSDAALGGSALGL